jgi:hypothetical protein
VISISPPQVFIVEKKILELACCFISIACFFIIDKVPNDLQKHRSLMFYYAMTFVKVLHILEKYLSLIFTCYGEAIPLHILYYVQGKSFLYQS